MIDDLVKRLREVPVGGTGTINNNYWCRVGELTHDAADRIEELERHVELRDFFLVENDLWERFAKSVEGIK